MYDADEMIFTLRLEDNNSYVYNHSFDTPVINFRYAN
jgi:hypothetical protein